MFNDSQPTTLLLEISNYKCILIYNACVHKLQVLKKLLKQYFIIQRVKNHYIKIFLNL